MKKILLALSVFLLFSTIAEAQVSMGITVGYSRNELYTNISYYANHLKKGDGHLLAIPVQYALKDWFSIQIEPGVIKKSFILGQSQQTFKPTELTHSYYYAQMPLITQFSFGSQRLRGFVDLGGYACYWTAGRIRGTQPDTFNLADHDDQIFEEQEVRGTYEFSPIRDRRLQFGLLAGAGVKHSLSNKISLLMDLRYYHDLSDQQKEYMIGQVPRYNSTTTLSAGVMYRFN